MVAIASTALRRLTTAPRADMRIAPRMNASVAINTSPCGTIDVMVEAIMRTSSSLLILPRTKYKPI